MPGRLKPWLSDPNADDAVDYDFWRGCELVQDWLKAAAGAPPARHQGVVDALAWALTLSANGHGHSELQDGETDAVEDVRLTLYGPAGH